MRRLAEAGHQTFGADREVDITKPTVIAAALDRFAPDAVIHLAAMSSVAQSFREPERCYQLNFVGTRNLLAAAIRHCPQARVLLIGSADQYAAATSAATAIDESMPLKPRSPYARTKTAAEMLGRLAMRKGLDVVRVRAFNHTGAGQNDQFVVSSFARQIARIRLGKQEAVMRVGNLESVRDFLHVDDVIRAYLALLGRQVPADTYNVASGRSATIQQILDHLLTLADVKPLIEADPARWRETDWRIGDASRLTAVTGWQPEISLETILRELYEDWLAQEGSP